MSKRPTKLKGPEVGSDIYVPTALYLSHGADDFIGGLCRVISVEDRHDSLWVRVAERPGTQYNWKGLSAKQADYKEQYGDKRGYPNPDLDPEFNRWD